MAISDIEPASRVASPCVRKCTLDDDDICIGCFRNIDEICAWGSASNEQRRDIMLEVEARRKLRAQSG